LGTESRRRRKGYAYGILGTISGDAGMEEDGRAGKARHPFFLGLGPFFRLRLVFSQEEFADGRCGELKIQLKMFFGA